MADYPDEPPFVRKQILYGMLHTFLLKDGVQVGNVSLVMEIDAHQPFACFAVRLQAVRRLEGDQSKESGNKDERGKTRAVVDRFFRNIERFYREYIDKNFEEKLNNLILRDSDGEEAVINISELYADLLQRSIEESVSFEEKQKQDKVKEMMDSLDFDVQPDEPLQSVSTYLKNKSAENVLKNVKNIIHNMKRYQVRHKDEKVEGDNAGFIIMREYAIDYYQRVAEFWVENPKLDIPEEMSKEYKDIAKDCSKYNEEK